MSERLLTADELAEFLPVPVTERGNARRRAGGPR